MKKSEYIKAMENIKPKPGVKEEIWEKLNAETKEDSKQGGWRYAVVTLLVLCVAAFSLPAVASGIRSLILQKMPSYESMEAKIETGIFTKSDEHLQMTVEEILSDGMCVYLTVCYTALDDAGRIWLSEYESSGSQYDMNLNLKPYIEDYTVSATNYSWRTVESEEVAQENERRFLLILETTSRDYDSGKGVLRYPMSDAVEETILEIDGNAEVLSFELSGKEAVSELYQPTYMEISAMSYVIYAKNFGVYERTENTEKWLMPDEEFDALEETCLIMKDGSRYQVKNISSCTTTSKETNNHSDLVLMSGMFCESKEDGTEIPVLMDPNAVVGVEIKGVYYELKK